MNLKRCRLQRGCTRIRPYEYCFDHLVKMIDGAEGVLELDPYGYHHHTLYTRKCKMYRLRVAPVL